MSFKLSKKFITLSLNRKRITIPIIYEDQWLVVVNKPTKILTISALRRNKEIPTLTEVLNEDFKKKSLPHRLHPCHRLDRDTSGLIVYAKGKSVQKKLMRLFKQRKIRKIYFAFVYGNLSEEKGEIRFPIENESAYTEYKVIEKRKDFTIVEIIPYTGRTNQIRIHFKSIGHPVVGEKKFVFRRDFRLKANRLCLHAKTLEFIHPVTNEAITLDSGLPLGMQNFLKKHPT